MTDEELKIYRKVQREFLTEDARNFVREHLAYIRECDEDDITDEELDSFDYDYLVDEYQDHEDCNVPFNSTWEYVVENYFKYSVTENE